MTESRVHSLYSQTLRPAVPAVARIHVLTVQTLRPREVVIDRRLHILTVQTLRPSILHRPVSAFDGQTPIMQLHSDGMWRIVESIFENS